MKRWQRLGLDEGRLDRVLTSVDYAIRDEQPFDTYLGQDAARASAIHTRFLLVLLAHVEFAAPGYDPLQSGREAARMSVEYFYGPWRNGFVDIEGKVLDAALARQNLRWIDEYRDGLLSALVVDEEQMVRRLLEWPKSDLQQDGGTLDLTRADICYHVLVARFLRGMTLTESANLATKVRSGTRRRPKMLLSTLEAIAAGDTIGFISALSEYLRYYRKIEFSPHPLNRCISIEGTLLWHVAKRTGMPAPLLPQDLADLIVTRESIRPGTPD